METKTFKEISQNYIYWETLSQPYLNNVNFSQSKIDDIIPMFREFTNHQPEALAPKIYEFYGTNYLINYVCKKHSNIVPKEYLDLYLHYQDTLKDMSQKIFSYIFIISFIEASFCESFSEKVSNHLSETLSNYDLFSNDLDYREYHKAITNPKGQKIINQLIQDFVPKELINKENLSSLHALFIELCFNSQNSNYMTVAEMADEVMAGYGMIGFKTLSLDQTIIILKNIFNIGKFDKDYGGAKWQDILNHLHNFVLGQINSEIFIDQSLSLEHNNGTLFSKHTIFQTSENFNLLLTSQDSLSFDDKYINFNKILLNAQNHSNVFITTHSDYSEELVKHEKNNNKEAYDNINQFNILKKYLLNKCNNFIVKFQDIIPKIDNLQLSDMLNPGSYWDKKFNQYQSYQYTKPNRAYTFNVFTFNDVAEQGLDKYRVGSKAYGLAQLKKMDINTPDGVVLDTYTCLSFLNNPLKFQQFFSNDLRKLSNLMGTNQFPKMVSVRSGSSISMPGMMDTILNVGIDDQNYEALCQKHSQQVIDNCSKQFMDSLLSTLGVKNKINYELPLSNNLKIFRTCLNNLKIPLQGLRFPLTKEQQLNICIQNVFKSWNSERAIAWRNENNISHNLGTACIIQEMVLGNQNENSMSGVIFSRDCVLGSSGMIGEFIFKSQGESVVSGTITPQPIDDLLLTHPHIYEQLKNISETLEKAHSEIKDIEFTVEDNKIYILQHRKAIATAQANANLLKNQLKLLTEIDLKLLEYSLEVQTTEKADIIGKAAQEGILHGLVISNEHDKEKFQKEFKQLSKESNFTIGWILSTHNSSPEHVPSLLNSDAFITQQGGYTSHAAIIARSLKKPCIVGTGTHDLKPGDIITMNAYTGEIWKGIIPVVYDNNKSYSLSRNILDVAKINPDEVTMLNKDSEQEIKAWFENFSNYEIVQKPSKNNNLSSLQQAAIAIVNHHKKKIKP